MKHLYNPHNNLHECRILTVDERLLPRRYTGIVWANTGLQEGLSPVRTKSEWARPPVGRLLCRPPRRDDIRQPVLHLTAVAGAWRGLVRDSRRRPPGACLELPNALAPKLSQ